MENKDRFIKSTARDYDMTYEEVKKIMNKYPETYYEELEKFITERRYK